MEPGWFWIKMERFNKCIFSPGQPKEYSCPPRSWWSLLGRKIRGKKSTTWFSNYRAKEECRPIFFCNIGHRRVISDRKGSAFNLGNLSYTSGVGQLACQGHRLFRYVGDDNDIAHLRSEKLDRNLRLPQINNCRGLPTASGAPVFSSSGRVIGLFSLVLNNFDLAVHLTFLKGFYNSYQEREGNERGKSPRKWLSILARS